MTTRRATQIHGKPTPVGGGGMFVAAPPLVRGKPVASAAPHSMARVLKRAAPSQVPASNQTDGTSSSIDSYVQEKLAFDELLRVQRSRAEDVGKLIAELGSALAAESESEAKDREKGRKAAMFREEWRVGREDEVLGRLRAEEAREASMAEADRLAKTEVVRAHVRRSIHLFLTAERTPSKATDSQKTKLSNDLFYAQQMDRLLREMDQNHPFIVVRHAIADARAKFQQLLNCVGRNADASALLGLRQEPNIDAYEERASSVAGVETMEDTDVLHLYENVVDARAVAQTTKPSQSMTSKQTKRQVTPRTHEPSAEFVMNLEKQRNEADRQAAEAQAQTHWRRVCANRIMLRYRRYRRRMEWQSRADALRQRVEIRAATTMQASAGFVIRQFRALEDAKAATKRRHQGRRLAICCFWKWTHPTRCGFATFQFTTVVTNELLTLIICVQSMWRRWKALQETAFRRNFRDFRRKRQRQRQWEQRRRQAQATAPLSLRLAEWLCHVAIEKRRVERELRRELTRFAAEWTRYESRLEKDVMKSRLPAEWIPQLDPLSGETFYLNVQTTKTRADHPNMLLCRQLLKKQKLRAEQLFDERLQRLEQYTARLETDNEAMTAMLFEKIHMALK